MKMEISNMNDVLAAMNALAEIEEMFPEVEQETTDEDQDDSIPMYTREVDRLRYSIRRKEDFKAKDRLNRLYPISTDSIRKTRNGAPIHKGNTCKWDWKRYDNKLSRLEGKRLCREWEPEEPETVYIPEDEDILTRISDLEEELHWNMMELSAAQEEVDYYLEECLAISNEIERLRKLL